MNETNYLAFCECRTWATSNLAKESMGNGHNGACYHFKIIRKVYRLNDMEWWIGPSLLITARAAAREYGLSLREMIDKEARSLSEDELLKLKFVDDDGQRKTFAEELMSRPISDFPEPFAGTEY